MNIYQITVLSSPWIDLAKGLGRVWLGTGLSHSCKLNLLIYLMFYQRDFVRDKGEVGDSGD